MNFFPRNERVIFEQVLEMEDASDRESFLDDVCGSDFELKKRLVRLLDAHARAGSFLEDRVELTEEPSTVPLKRTAVLVEGPGSVIDRYRLMERIGEGGFGVVYLAMQTTPITRPVALKIIKLGMDTRQVVNRFAAEQQTLAIMNHPNIAKVLDGGSTSTGRPYFVMELVPGPPITQFCDEQGLGIPARLRLFIQVCDAIQHAHQKAIIHRDIKPSNVLVATEGDTPVPKVIDFGIAKAIRADDRGSAFFTSVHEWVGTPSYMSPEQAGMAGLDIDTRSDVYSLGVLLYELLTGLTPFKFRRGLVDPEELRKIIREQEPLPPSQKVLENDALIRANHGKTPMIQPGVNARELRGDLDWIVLKAMDKDRTRRYDSAGLLARDVQRYLDNEPVIAAAPSPFYRIRKFYCRHKTPVLATGMGGLLLFISLLVIGILLRYANRAHEVARGEAAIAEAVNRFINEDFFMVIDREAVPDREIKLRHVLDRASLRVDQRFRHQPLVEAAIRMTLGRSYVNLAEYEDAERHFNRAYELRFHEMGAGHEDVIDALSELAMVHSFQHKHDSAQELADRALKLSRLEPAAGRLLTARCLARLSWAIYSASNRARLGSARRCAEEAVAVFERHPGVAVEDHALAHQVLGRLKGRSEGSSAGEANLRKALVLLRNHFGDSHPQTLGAYSRLVAYLYDHSLSIDEAEQLAVKALETSRLSLGESHFRSITLRENLSLIYHFRMRDRIVDGLMQDLKIVQFRIGGPLEKDKVRIQHFFDTSTYINLPEIRATFDWMISPVQPAETWYRSEYEARSIPWEKTNRIPTPECWMRAEILLDSVMDKDWILLIHHEGEFEVCLNGEDSLQSATVRLRDRTMVVVDARQPHALKMGGNMIAIHGRGLKPGEILNLEFRLASKPPLESVH